MVTYAPDFAAGYGVVPYEWAVTRTNAAHSIALISTTATGSPRWPLRHGSGARGADGGAPHLRGVTKAKNNGGRTKLPCAHRRGEGRTRIRVGGPEVVTYAPDFAARQGPVPYRWAVTRTNAAHNIVLVSTTVPGSAACFCDIRPVLAVPTAARRIFAP